MASRTVSRLTPSRAASSRSGGKRFTRLQNTEPDGLQQPSDGVLERHFRAAPGAAVLRLPAGRPDLPTWSYSGVT